MTAAIFDMDGVIVDSEQYWSDEQEAILQETVESAAVSPDDLRGMNVMDQYDHLTDRYTVTVEKDVFFEKYDERAAAIYTERADLMPRFTAVVDRLQDAGVAVGLASSSFRDWIEMVLDRFGLHDAFSVVVSAEDIDGRSKPAPDIYRYTAERLGEDPSRCIVVEDSAHGVTAAKDAGMHCIGFRTVHNTHQNLSHADVVVDGADGLFRFVRDEEYHDLLG